MNPTLQEIIEPLLNSKYTIKDITPAHELRKIIEDSLACVELLLNINDYMDVFITDKDFDKIITVGDLEAYIQKYKPAEKCASH